MTAVTKAILIVDDETSMCEMLELAVKKWGHRPRIAQTLKEAIAAAERGRIDCIISDIKLPDGSGVELIQRIKSLPEQPPVILITAFGNTDAAVQAMKLGAFHYVTKPFKLEDLRNHVENALGRSESNTSPQQNNPETLESKDTKDQKTPSQTTTTRTPIIGAAPALQKVQALIARVAKTKTHVLVTGESGTGKELIAREIHFGGVLKDQPFVAVNCGAIPENLIESELFGHKRGSFTGAVGDKEGLFKVADKGTIFLDEIGELPLSMQVKLLRVLQDKTIRPVGSNEDYKIDVRVISATNRNLEEAISKGTFREDLYYRLNVINIKSPPLRDRREDIPTLVDHFIKKYSVTSGKTVTGIAPDALNTLMHYPFPGNIRELENIIERSMALEGSTLISLESLPNDVQRYAKQAESVATNNKTVTPHNSFILAAREHLMSGPVNLTELINEIERAYINEALLKTDRSIERTAKLLGLTVRNLKLQAQKLNIPL